MDPKVVVMAAGVFVFGVIFYVGFMIFLPEWVGITGKKAREAQRAHLGDVQASGPDVTDKTKDQGKNKDEDGA